MALSIKTVRAIARSGAGTQDFMVSGFGTVQAAIIHHQLGGNGSDVAGDLWGVGFYDGTNQYAAYFSSEDAIAASDLDYTVSGAYNNRVLHSRRNSTSTVARSATAAFITDGVRLTFDGQADLPIVTVILINGITSAFVGSYIGSTTLDSVNNVTTTGCNPNCLIQVGQYATTINVDLADVASMTVGFAARDGAQMCFGRMMSSSNPTGCGAQVITDRVGAVQVHTSYGEYEITAWGTGQFTFTQRGGTLTWRPIQIFLALELSTEPDVFLATTPTTSIDWDPFVGTSLPEAVIMIPTFMTVVDASDILKPSTGGGFYVVTPEAEYGGYSVGDDAVATTNSSGRYGVMLFNQAETGGAPVFSASSPAFDSTGLLYSDANVAQAAAAYKFIGISFLNDEVIAAPPTLYQVRSNIRLL